ncbi:hypothetical protein O181_121745 [Austropuccinia psidii MF-1]|uniref:Uncharacterized protein n=1 Tax=Austropuccinia psidii MF-1 TaxID=1389203 RepID=A0A9Q3KI37_9BASI|nr:hypothetical protein [Austropuccinia psidii MF-1]
MKMVHTRNGSNYSDQPDGSGQGRGKTRARSGNSSSRKTCLEARVAPIPQGNILRAEPFPSGSHRNIPVPVQTLVQSSQERGVGNIPKHLAGGHELLITHQELSRSGVDHRTLRRVEPIVLQRQGEKDSLLSIDQKKELKMTPALEKEGPVASSSSKTAPEMSKDKPK